MKTAHWRISLDNKVKVAKERIIKAFKDNNNLVFVSHSGGKDSCVVYDLVKTALGDGEFPVIHNVKPLLGTSGTEIGALTEMHPETLEFLYSKVASVHPVYFFHASEMKDFIDVTCARASIDGSRLCEYTRKGKSSEFIKNGKNVSRSEMTDYIENGLFGLNQCFPIFDWSDDDVFDYIEHFALDISEEYTKNGELLAYHKRKAGL